MVGRFADASNATLLVRLLDRDPAPIPDGAAIEDLDPLDLAVYKPRRGERPLWDFPDGTLHLREVGAFRLAEIIGWDLVPLTVLREDGPFGVGSLQRFVPHDPNRHYFTIRDRWEEEDDAATAGLRRQLEQMVLLDAAMSNADRKGGHVLVEDVDGDERIRLVDHGVCFHFDNKLRTVAWDFAEEPVNDADRVAVAAAATAIRDGHLLGDLLSSLEHDALLRRLDDVAQWEVFPHPIGEYPFPWPLV